LSDTPFRTRFRRARQGKQLTQAAVAKALKVSQSAVAQWEGGRSFPSADLAAQIRRLLGVEVGAADDSQLPQARGVLRKQARLPIVGVAGARRQRAHHHRRQYSRRNLGAAAA